MNVGIREIDMIRVKGHRACRQENEFRGHRARGPIGASNEGRVRIDETRSALHVVHAMPVEIRVDTLDLLPLPGVVFKHFTARDVVSRWDVLEVHTRATARAAAAFLDAIEARMPFPVRAIQVDGGSEFQAQFEQECQRRQIRLFVLPPRSPKLNGSVERAQRTHTEEFYEVWDLTWAVPELNRQLRAWEEVYNTVRPHQSLGQRTPERFLHELAVAST